MNSYRFLTLALVLFASGSVFSQQTNKSIDIKPAPKITPSDLPDPTLFLKEGGHGISVRSIKDFPEASRAKFEAKFKAEKTTAHLSKASAQSSIKTVTVWDHGVEDNDASRRIAKTFAENIKSSTSSSRGRDQKDYSFKFSNIDASSLSKLQLLGVTPSGDLRNSPLTSAIRVFVDSKGTIFSLQEDDFSSTAAGSAMIIKELLVLDVNGKPAQLVKSRNMRGDETWLLNWIHKEERTISLTVNCETGACINAEEMLKIGTSIVTQD